MSERTFSTSEAATIVGVTYRQVDYWCRAGLLPDQPWGSATGSGKRRRLTYRDLVRVHQLRVVSLLRSRSFVEVAHDLDRLGVLAAVGDSLGVVSPDRWQLPAPDTSTRAALPAPERVEVWR